MRRALLETSKHASKPLRAQSSPRFVAGSSRPVACASFSTSRRTQAEASNESAGSSSSSSNSTKNDSKKGKSSSSSKNDERAGQVGKSPFAVFVDVLREELQKSKDLQDNVRQLQGSATEAMDSEAMKKAKAYYERARVSPGYSGSTIQV